MKLDPEETILLTEEQYERMLELIRNPPEPSPALIEAAKRYKERIKNETKT
jgi:uncharacterized protein (DUF1778 family)